MACYRSHACCNLKEVLKKALQQKMEEFVNQTVSQIKEEREFLEVAENRHKTNLERIEKTEHDHSVLRAWRDKRIAVMKAAADAREKYYREKLHLDQQSNASEEMRRADEKKKIQKYHDRLKEQRLLQQQITMELAFKDQAIEAVRKKVADILFKINEERILYRQGRRQEKLNARQKELESK
jgi:hypothetical protein